MRVITGLLIATLATPIHAQSLSDAFNQGTTLGYSGNAAARGQITGSTAPTIVPGYTANPPETSYFGSPGLTGAATTRIGACVGGAGAAGGYADQACNAVEFSQTNPTRRPIFSIAPGDPLLTRGRTITADPQAIAGNIAGTYSGCSVQTASRPGLFETQTCHQYRTLETLSCDKVLIVTPVVTPGCTPGQLLTRVTADPCPACMDSLAFEFTCGTGQYVMHVFTIDRVTGALYMDLGEQSVPGALDTQIPKTPGPTRIDGYACYQTAYSQSCSGPNCTIGVWFDNPCQATSAYGANSFAMPTTVSFTDAWDNRCTTLEARAQ